MAPAAHHGRTHKSAPRGWWREYFIDCPINPNNVTQHLFGAISTGKTKAYCKSCYELDLSQLKQRELELVADGAISYERDDAILANQLWEEGEGSRFISTASAVLINHLCDCPIVDMTVKTRAQALKNEKKAKSPQAGSRYTSQNAFPGPPIPGPSFGGHMSISLNDNIPSGSMSHTHADPYSHYDTLSDLPAHAYTTIPGSPHSTASALSHSASSGSLDPSDSVSSVGSRRQHRHHPYPTTFAPHHVEAWTLTQVKRWERLLTELTASAGFPLSWVENPVWHTLLEEFIPQAPNTSRKVLTSRLLRDAALDVQELVKNSVKGKDVTLQADGWTGLNHHHLIAFMVACEKKVYTVKVHDASGERKTAEALLKELEDVVSLLENEWGAKVIAIVTDASGESRKARRLFGRKYPWVIVLDCYSHQINLVVGDFCRCKSNLLKYTDMATELITWLRSKTLILHNLPLAVLRAILTRWTAHYTAFRRLLDLQPTLAVLAANDLRINEERQRVMITGKADAQRHARKMITIINDATFWQSLLLITRYLEPLAIAANITQDAHCRMDQVLLTFGFLFMIYSRMNEDSDAQAAILKSLEQRWKKSEQELFIAAVLLNPLYHTAPFASGLHFLTLAHLRPFFIRIWKRLNKTQNEPDFEFTLALNEYFQKIGAFSELDAQVDIELKRAERERRQPDPIDLWKTFCNLKAPHSSFIEMAIRILSISANSASCERLFSSFGNILTKLRTRLTNDTLVNLSTVKMSVRDRYLEPHAKQRLKRHFAAPIPPLVPTADTPAVTTSNSGLESGFHTPSVVHAGPPHISAHPDIHSPIQFPPSHPTMATTTTLTSSFTDFNFELDQDQEMEPPLQESSTNESPNTRYQGFRQIVERHHELSTEDDQDNEPVRASIIGAIPLSMLFDFGDRRWSDRYKSSAMLSYEEELALYELLEVGADTEEDPDMDSTVDEILSA